MLRLRGQEVLRRRFAGIVDSLVTRVSFRSGLEGGTGVVIRAVRGMQRGGEERLSGAWIARHDGDDTITC
jgi:hypothetical protein